MNFYSSYKSEARIKLDKTTRINNILNDKSVQHKANVPDRYYIEPTIKTNKKLNFYMPIPSIETIIDQAYSSGFNSKDDCEFILLELGIRGTCKLNE